MAIIELRRREPDESIITNWHNLLVPATISSSKKNPLIYSINLNLYLYHWAHLL